MVPQHYRYQFGLAFDAQFVPNACQVRPDRRPADTQFSADLI
jgi:hypothetical protein